MRSVIFAIAILIAGLGSAYLIIPQGKSALASDETSSKQLYTCGMHPEIVTDEPGYCPICGMKLTPKKDGTAPEGSIIIDPTTTQNMGLKTVPVTRGTVTRNVTAFGRADYAEPLIHTINLKISGWIEKLYVDYQGDMVFKDQPLLEIYSPDLVAAQKEFLIAFNAGKNNSENMADFLKAARQRLANWDISDDQIQNLIEQGDIARNMTIRSPVTGIVFAKHVAEGEHLKPGSNLYEIADLSTIWVRAYVYEQELPFVKKGQEAIVTFPNIPGEKYNARIDYVSPFLNEKRQLEIRLDLDNPEYVLRPDMYAEVNIRSEADGEKLIIPRSAVINSGMKQVVFVASGDGAYSPRVITTGIVGDNDMVEVRSGLNPNDRVVVSGQFLLDSESRLEEALAGGHHHSEPQKAKPEQEQEDVHSHESSEGHDTRAATVEMSPERELSGVYTCPMSEHYHVLQYGEGNCGECGMKLVPVEETDNTEVYTCPMSVCQVVENEPGNCPKCGMHLQQLHPEEGHDH
jgi:Cu(I)/Ag(I) efflux system membrane fusion protein/cobalt-zinc-cadmium efflux system membrane fusion protein